MVVMNCTVRRQLLNIDVPTIVSGSYDYINVVGSFSSEWDGMQKWIHIRNVENPTVMFDALFVNDQVGADTGLNLTAGQWDVWIHGASYVDNTLIKRLTTQVKLIRVEEGGSNELPDVPESVAEQIAAVADQALEVAQSVREDADNGEFDGATFTPSVSEAGLLSWTNDKGLPNPQSVNIKGPKGDPGSGGGYEPPAGGIPASDLSTDVQSALAKANSALQEVPSTYRTASAQDEIDNTQNEKINPLYTDFNSSDTSIQFNSPAPVRPSRFIVAVTPSRSGSGDPSPSNPRPNAAKSAEVITHNGTNISIPFSTPSCGGRLDAITGEYQDYGRIVNIADLNWDIYKTARCFRAILSGRRFSSSESFCFCSHYNFIGSGSLSWIEKHINSGECAYQSTQANILVRDERFMDDTLYPTNADKIAAFIAANADSTIVYALREPPVVQLPAPALPVSAGENTYTAGGDNIDITVNAYLSNLQQQVDAAARAAMIAPVEGSTVSRAYAVNDFLIYNNQICKVTAPIQSGGTIQIGVNAVITTLGAEITALLNS